MTSWNRRVSAASARQRPVFSKEELLRDAVALGVEPDDQAALLALGRVAAERPGYRTTLAVRVGEGVTHEVLFEVAYTDDGPVARQAGTAAAATPRVATEPVSDAAGTADEAPPEAEGGPPDILEILSDTLVETPDLVVVFASVGHEAIWANDAFVTLVPIREVDKVWLVELLDEWSKGHYEVKVLPALVKYGRWRGRLTLVPGGGEPLPVSAVIVAHRDTQGEIEAVSMVARDITDLRLAEERVEASETRFSALVEHASDLIAVLDAQGVIAYTSPATSRVLGVDDDALVGAGLIDLIHPDDVPADLTSLAHADEQGIGAPVELRLRAADGSWRYLEVVVSDLTDNPAIGGLVLNARDVTERVETSYSLATKAFTDQLTGLPNRMRVLDRLAQALQEAAGTTSSVAVLLLDLDHFRSVNDRFDKQTGDETLQALAGRLTAAVDPGATVARLRSDEFAVVLPGLHDRADAVRLAGRLLALVAEPIATDAHTVDLTASIGVSFGGAGDEPDALLRDADRALAAAKASGGNATEMFSEQLALSATHRLEIEQRLREVVDHDELVVHYQPIIEIDSEQVVAAEALLRVRSDEGALLSPAEFIEAAESTGLIHRLGSQMLHMTCAQLAAWSDQPGAAREVSVNVSPRQLADPEFTQQVIAALNAAGVRPDRLSLEITEHILIGHQHTVDTSISYLRELGVRIGLDEFGAGQSSLGYLKRFPLDFVKIDRSLVSGLGTNEQDTAIVRATVELAHNLGLSVVAVGVESEDQLDMLHLLGCDRAQGYLFAPAVPADEFVNRSGPA